jgi:tetratricopeptide (TPR) repeat protein
VPIRSAKLLASSVLAGGLCLSGCRATHDRLWLDQALAHRELEQGNAGRAIELLDRCKRDRPDYAPTYLSLAAAWAQRGDRDQFRENIAIYRRLNPTHDVADLYLAEAEFKDGQLDRANMLFDEFLKGTSAQFDAKTLSRRAHAFERLAEIAHQQGNGGNEHLYLARLEATKAWRSAIEPVADNGQEGRSPDDRRQEIQASLACALEELQAARSLSSSQDDKVIIDKEIDIVRRMLEDADTGRLADLAFLLAARTEVESTSPPSSTQETLALKSTTRASQEVAPPNSFQK